MASTLKYLIIGAGGTGGAIGGFLKKAGNDVTLIARGKHLEEMRKNGLSIKSDLMGDFNLQIPCYTMGEFETLVAENPLEKPDVIILCVKGYGVADSIPFMQKVAKAETIIMPILNIFGTGAQIRKEMPGNLVLDGCMYIVGYISQPGEITQSGDMFKLVYGKVDDKNYLGRLEVIDQDLKNAGMKSKLSEDILADTFYKFSFISPLAVAGAYFDTVAGTFKKPGKEQDFLLGLFNEILALGEKMGIHLEGDIVAKNMETVSKMGENGTTSMQKDLAKGGNSEIDGLLFQVIKWAEEYNISLPHYQMAYEKFRDMK